MLHGSWSPKLGVAGWPVPITAATICLTGVGGTRPGGEEVHGAGWWAKLSHLEHIMETAPPLRDTMEEVLSIEGSPGQH